MAYPNKVNPSSMLHCYTLLLRYVSCFTWRIAGVVSCMERCDKLISSMPCNYLEDSCLRKEFLMHCRDCIRLAWFCTIHPSCLVLNFCVQNLMFPEYVVCFIRDVELQTVESLDFLHLCILGMDFSNIECVNYVVRMIRKVRTAIEKDSSQTMQAAVYYMAMLIEAHRVVNHTCFGRTELDIHFPVEIRHRIMSLVLSAHHRDIPFRAIAYAHVLRSPSYCL